MRRTALLYNNTLEFEEKISNRAKRLRIAVYYDQSIVVTVPQGVPYQTVEKYIIKKSKWIFSKIDFFASVPQSRSLTLQPSDYFKYRDMAMGIAQVRIEHFNRHYEFHFNQINIKDLKTRWGSCTKKQDLNFNFRITHLPPAIRDYIFVHELCHLKERNHSKKFWSLVGQEIPNYKNIIKELKMKGLYLY